MYFCNNTVCEFSYKYTKPDLVWIHYEQVSLDMSEVFFVEEQNSAQKF